MSFVAEISRIGRRTSIYDTIRFTSSVVKISRSGSCTSIYYNMRSFADAFLNMKILRNSNEMY